MPTPTLASQVRARREALGMTRPALAAASGVSPSTLARLELQNHVPSVRALTAIAKALDLPLASLMERAA